MKRIIFTLIFFLGLFVLPSFAQSQNEHIPPCQGSHHDDSICYGYAIARAFGRGWNDSPCGASDMYFTSIPTTYFQ